MARPSAPAGRLLNATPSSESTTRTEVMMGTFVTMQVVHRGAANDRDGRTRRKAMDQAFEWFSEVERCCSRFDPASELRQLSEQIGRPTPVSPMLFAAVEFALSVAAETEGAFDPTVGVDMERRGFDVHYLTGATTPTAMPVVSVSYRDVRLDTDTQRITFDQPLLLDLGAVAKGLAIDLAARELAGFEHYAVDAGGDVFVAGQSPAGTPWSIGISHPRDERDLVAVVHLSNAAVCTSGDYERPGRGSGHHIMDARTRDAADRSVSATAVAPTALVADALATAAFVLGPAEGVALLERHGVDGLVISPDLSRHATRGFRNHA